MKKKDVFVAILAGGRGERLWPKSRTHLPKQNLKIFSNKTLFENAVNRARKIAGVNVFIVTGKTVFPYKGRALKKLRVKRVILEPFGRNTAPAVGLAALLACRENKGSVLVAMPSDSFIGNEKRFFSAINTAIDAARKEETIVTLGIKPTSANSAYGYIGVNQRPSGILAKKAYQVTKFIEKPDTERAVRLVSDGRYFWNSGIFVFKTSTMLRVLKRHTPALYKGLTALPEVRSRRFDMKLKELYKRIKAESLDYAVIEKSGNIQVIPSDFKWSDLGSFDSIAGLAKKDKDGNVVFANHVGVDTEESVIFSDTKRLISTVGLKGVIVVDTPDAILVCDKERGEDIKRLVGKIKKKKSLEKFL